MAEALEALERARRAQQDHPQRHAVQLELPFDIPGVIREMPLDMIRWALESKLPDWNDPDISRSRILSYLYHELVRRYPCQDCGAPAGRECYPEYGCTFKDRRP